MLHFAIDARALAPCVPAGTELDAFASTPSVSLVGFDFLDTRVLGVPIPFHGNFEEVNLRSCVRAPEEDGSWRRGVVFVREVVPRRAIAAVARLADGERYVTCPMRSERRDPEPGRSGKQAPGWRAGGAWLSIGVEYEGEPWPLAPDTQDEFFAEHDWGYTRRRGGGTLEYEVELPPWRIWPATAPELEGDVAGFYGPEFAEALSAPPVSAFLAGGSTVRGYRGERRVQVEGGSAARGETHD